MSLKDKLIKLLNGYTKLELDYLQGEIQFLRTQLDRLMTQQEVLEALRQEISNKREPDANPVRPAPVKLAREPWMVMKHRLETEDYQRMQQAFSKETK